MKNFILLFRSIKLLPKVFLMISSGRMKGQLQKKIFLAEPIKTVQKTFKNRFFSFKFIIFDLKLFQYENTTSTNLGIKKYRPKYPKALYISTFHFLITQKMQ